MFIHLCLPFGLPSHPGPTVHSEFPVLCSLSSLVSYFMHNINNMYVPVPGSQFLPPLPFPLGIQWT